MGNSADKRSILRQSLDHLNEKYLDTESKIEAIDKILKEVKSDHVRLKGLIDLIKKQIKQEENIENINDIKPNDPIKI